ncbi:MAG: FHA domain-containing protein [Acidimicrobiales bacterium]|jgi:hypothetical protein|nr:FHA domain-containing protein [Acidimicrobiales bacterium]
MLPVGVLICDDGTIVPLEGEHILGREPGGHPDVAAGRARAFAFPDTEPEISRVHLQLTVSGGEVLATDLGSANGTFIALPGASVWEPLPAGLPTPLPPGCHLLLGRRTIAFRSPP